MSHDARALVKIELFKNALEAITDEAALTIVRTARSLTTRESMDFSTALFDAQGRQIAQGLCLPFQVHALPEFMPTILREFAGDLHPGDVVVSNDPYLGGTHLPDLLLFKPVFHCDRLIGFGAVLAHLTDIGGRVPGGTAVDSTELYQEGLCIPPVKLYDRGRRNDWLLRLIASNVRMAEDILGDIDALVASLARAENGFVAVASQYPPEQFARWIARLLDHAETLVRHEIRNIPDGRYHFEDWVDTDAVSDRPIRLCCNVTVAEDSLNVDLTGSSAQVASALNVLPSTTKAAVLTAIRCVFTEQVPSNAGQLRPIRIELPRHSVVNPDPPAACAARGVVAYRIFDAVMGCFAQALPERVPAAGEGGVAFMTLGGHNSANAPFVLVDVFSGAWGAGPDRDGIEGVSHLGANVRMAAAEIIEAEFPIRVERREFVPDSGGAGKYRGGMSYRYDLRLLAPEAVLAVRADRGRFRPWGLAGGAHGAAASCTLNPGTTHQMPRPLLFTGKLSQNDVISLVLAGGGGHGQPFERDPQRVLEDVCNGKVSPEEAARSYGVVLVGDPLCIDTGETQALRNCMAAETMDSIA